MNRDNSIEEELNKVRVKLYEETLGKTATEFNEYIKLQIDEKLKQTQLHTCEDKLRA